MWPHLILPALTLAIVTISGTMRYQRTAMLQAFARLRAGGARPRLTERQVSGATLAERLFPMLTLFGLWLPSWWPARLVGVGFNCRLGGSPAEASRPATIRS